MTLFVWLNENGQWQVTHLPPPHGFDALRMVIGEVQPYFFDYPWNDEVELKVQGSPT